MRTGVAIIVPVGDCYLGRKHPGTGKYEFPGGEVLPGEDPRWAAFRECVEETGYAPSALRLVYTGEHVGRDGETWRALFYKDLMLYGTAFRAVHPDRLVCEDGHTRCTAVRRDQLTGPEGRFPDIYKKLFYEIGA